MFNTVIGKMVTAVLWTSPLGIASLIAAAICRACSLLGTLGALGLWLLTVMAGISPLGNLKLAEPSLVIAVESSATMRNQACLHEPCSLQECLETCLAHSLLCTIHCSASPSHLYINLYRLPMAESMQ